MNDLLSSGAGSLWIQCLPTFLYSGSESGNCTDLLLHFALVLFDLRRNFSRTSCVSVDIMLNNVVIQLELEFCWNLCTFTTLISRTFTYLGSLIHEHDQCLFILFY